MQYRPSRAKIARAYQCPVIRNASEDRLQQLAFTSHYSLKYHIKALALLKLDILAIKLYSFGMKSSDFSEAYPRTLPDRHLAAKNFEDFDMSTSRYWSNFFGEILHDHLTDPTGSNVTDDRRAVIGKQLHRYANWVAGERVQLVEKSSQHSTDESEKVATELHFHALNGGMMHNWLPIVGFNEQGGRSKGIAMGQAMLAIHGLQYYSNREGSAGKSSDYAYFSAINTNHRYGFESRANEIDSAIVLMELMRRRKELIVVPAPLQFEKFGFESGRDSDHSPNADFIGIEEAQAVGFQVKNIVHEQDIWHYDNSRIVMIDAGRDLGNERYRRMAHESSRLKLVSWGGTIAAQHVLKLQVTGKACHQLGLDQKFVVQQKMRARALVIDAAPYIGPATAILDERLAHYFEMSRELPPNSEQRVANTG